jgi:hypothetical protein
MTKPLQNQAFAKSSYAAPGVSTWRSESSTPFRSSAHTASAVRCCSATAMAC